MAPAVAPLMPLPSLPTPATGRATLALLERLVPVRATDDGFRLNLFSAVEIEGARVAGGDVIVIEATREGSEQMAQRLGFQDAKTAPEDDEEDDLLAMMDRAVGK